MQKLLFKMFNLRSGKVRVLQTRWRPSLKGWKYWATPCIAWLRLVLGHVNRSLVIQTSVFSVKCCQLGRRSGLKGLTLYLKTCHVLLMQSLPGTQLRSDSRAVGKVAVARCHDGLPAIIPAFARARIRKGCASTLRLWMTLLGVYRVIEYIGKKQIASIVTPGRPLSPQVRKAFWKFLVHDFMGLLETRTQWIPQDESEPFGKWYHDRIAPKQYDPRASASADSFKLQETNTESESVNLYYTSFATRGSAAAHWLSGEWGRSLMRYARLTMGISGLGLFMSDMESSRDYAREAIEAGKTRSAGDSMGMNGRLVGLPEPAGKVRIIALVDYWTQHLLLPLHDEIFSILKKIPTDGTFDQLRPVRRLLKKVSPETTIYSYDLKSATDRLSIKAQMMILSVMFSVRLAVAWKSLIVGRTYWLYCEASTTDGFQTDNRPPPGGMIVPAKAGSIGYRGLRYAQGQPMGAYSSWAMLALTHHVMVQWAAKMEGIDGWFDLYAVLGDDIIIAHDGVARRYRQVCEWFGVEIGLAKSLISKGKTCEFAKKLFRNGEDCSGLPLKLWAAAQTSMSVAVSLLAHYPKGTIANFVRALGVGFKGATALDKTWAKLPGRLRVLMVYLTHPLADNRFSFSDGAQWLWAHGPNRLWSSDQDGMVFAKPYLERVYGGDITRLREMIRDRKRSIFSPLVLRDPPVMNITLKALVALNDYEVLLENFAGTIEDAWWKWKKRSLNRVAEYAETSLDLLSKGGELLPGLTELTFRKVSKSPFYSISKLYRYWSQLRDIVLRGKVDPLVKLPNEWSEELESEEE
jgi:hypothetical protein